MRTVNGRNERDGTNGTGAAVSTIYSPDHGLTCTFMSMRNEVPLAGNVLEDISVPGVAGKSWIWTGFSGAIEVVYTTMRLNVGDSVGIKKLKQKMMQGHLVTVTDDFGEPWPNVMARTVRCGKVFPLVAGAGLAAGAAGVMITEWMLEPAAQWYSWIET